MDKPFTICCTDGVVLDAFSEPYHRKLNHEVKETDCVHPFLEHRLLEKLPLTCDCDCKRCVEISDKKKYDIEARLDIIMITLVGTFDIVAAILESPYILSAFR